MLEPSPAETPPAAEKTPKTGRSAKTEARAAGFMRSALAIIAETGRADFTVLEVVERSKTSLRAFYQHYSTKDDLLIALLKAIMADSTEQWRAQTAAMPGPAALRHVMDRIGAPASSSTQDSLNRGLTYSNDHLMETRPAEYAQVMQPLHRLMTDIVVRGIRDGDFRADIDPESTAAIVMQTALGALRLRRLAGELTANPIDSAAISAFCIRSLAP